MAMRDRLWNFLTELRDFFMHLAWDALFIFALLVAMTLLLSAAMMY